MSIQQSQTISVCKGHIWIIDNIFSACVAVGVALLLLSVVDSVWKLELDLALYSITAAVGVLTAVVIKKSWVTQPDRYKQK